MKLAAALKKLACKVERDLSQTNLADGCHALVHVSSWGIGRTSGHFARSTPLDLRPTSPILSTRTLPGARVPAGKPRLANLADAVPSENVNQPRCVDKEPVYQVVAAELEEFLAAAEDRPRRGRGETTDQ